LDFQAKRRRKWQKRKRDISEPFLAGTNPVLEENEKKNDFV
jgi:hypothetical protein